VAHAAPGIVLSDSSDVGSAAYLYFVEREQNQTMDGIGLLGQGTSTVTGAGEPELVQRLFATSDVLPLLGIEPLLGRYFSESEDAGDDRVVLLSYGYWQRRFGGDESVLGRTLTMNREPFAIIGVMPSRFSVPNQDVDVITPYGLDRSRVTVGGYFRPSVARLKPGVTLEEANADVARLIPIAIGSFPLGPGATMEQVERARLAPAVRPLKQDVIGDAGNTLWILMATIGIVLLMVSANVANLILVRTEGRQQELSIRAALGAGWTRIARELLTDSVLLGLAGGIVGVGFAYAGLEALLAVAPESLPRSNEITIDRTVLMFSFVASLVSGLLFGLIPVVRYARPKLAAALKSGGRLSSDGRERLRARSALVVVQVALAFVLLISAGLMIRTFQRLANVDPGFSRSDEVLTVVLTVPEASVPDPEATVRRQHEIRDRLAAVPGVESVAFASAVPMGGGFTADLLVPEGTELDEEQTRAGRQFRFVSPGLFPTLGVPIVTGRDFTWNDVYEKRPVVVVSENLARIEWGSSEDALGKRLRGSSTEDEWREIVGVVGEVRDQGLAQPVLEAVYVPALAERIFNTPTFIARSMTYAIRSSRTGTPGFLDEVRQAVWAVDPGLPLVSVRTMGEMVDDSIAPTSFTLVLLGIAGTVALVLAVIGLYGVIAYAVTQRRREIGIRLALGAHRRVLYRVFVRHGLVLAGIGTAAGLVVAVTVTRLMRALLFEVSPLDPPTYIVVAVLLVLAAILASYVPARRAAMVDPVEALKAE
jgi:predicted permease